MQKNIIVTGKPKSGKSTLLNKVISSIPNKIGFVTNEVRVDEKRIGFELQTHIGSRAMLASVDFNSPYKVSKYFVDIKNLESIIPEVSNFSSNDFLYLDEIGQMELFSEKFKELVNKYLNSPNTCIATLSYIFEDNLTKSIKERDDVILVEITAENRENKEQFITQLIKKIGKAKNYINEPDRFIFKDSEVELRSEHGVRKLTFQDGNWNCVCDFYKQYGICSHIIATKEFVKLNKLKNR
ncbi:hypothetical protein A2645_00910 [Candidatus Nomurabacteria bacterium RIFCSPHIGHO2_01_FULL_39_9]|uniref:SWIM-type domain-containing protein n=1 Tax=Candidatus Nomurabacteria bacterium RIFCSPHIGHO2_01_FULL_39_9 TaxID=1801735 RepID=A0A1F6UXC9_9BACT|nr:MAG: hypothetical protein A2645_00910 [Candidatus Nomurabacteria bacterium RIFCSPHIGHO2_01_FULL_39_9]